MLDYSGNLLWGLTEMGRTDVLAALRRTTEPALAPSIEWLGTMWSHAVVSSTPVPDLELHMLAWRHHFAELFGLPALARVRGFSPPEMDLPIHPDVCFAYVRALRECGYRWLMVQEHTVETARRDPAPPAAPAAPPGGPQLQGDTESIPVLVKTQGSDTKLVGQMQPFGEAGSLDRQPLGGLAVPPYALQIGDGENGGVMMNEFPGAYERTFAALGERGAGGVTAMNGTEYLEALAAPGHRRAGLPRRAAGVTAPHLGGAGGPRPGAADQAIARLRARDPSFNLDRASWTNERSWVEGYGDVMDPVLRAERPLSRALGPGRRRRAQRAQLPPLLALSAALADQLLSLLGPRLLDRHRAGDLPPRARVLERRALVLGQRSEASCARNRLSASATNLR